MATVKTLIGNIKGPKGEQGIQGVPGEQGIQGPKGDPYTLTDTDKNAIADTVKASLKPADIGAALAPIISQTDITAGSTALATGQSYHVYE